MVMKGRGCYTATLKHFADRFKEHVSYRPTFHSSLFRKLEETNVNFVESSFSMDKIKEAVWSCSSSKAPGPRGINFHFIKSYWDILKSDFFNCVKHFEETGRLANGCNESFIVLIPKKLDPLELVEYRPISLIGVCIKGYFETSFIVFG